MAGKTTYTKEMALKICDEIASGKPLTKICKQEGFPDYSTVMKWRLDIDSFSKMYAHAREDQADTLADEIIDISDDGLNDTYTDDKGNIRVDTDVVQRSKLRVDARKWVAAKLKPRKYGDSMSLTGSDGGPLECKSTVVVEVEAVSGKRPKAGPDKAPAKARRVSKGS